MIRGTLKIQRIQKRWLPKAGLSKNLKKYNESLKAFDRAIELDPKNPDFWLAKGSALNIHGKFNESLKALNQAIALNRNDPSYYTAKASALAGLGRQYEALGRLMTRP